jgi:peptide/nickel transport system substrate-binding protein
MIRLSRVLAMTALLMSPVLSAQAQPSGTFRQAHPIGSGSASDLDPISKGRVFEITDKLMSRLVRPDADGKPVADLALSWTSSADAKEWIFKLRPGVMFHNGKPFLAEDVTYSFARVQDPKIDSPARASIKMITKIEAVDQLTVRMILEQPFADLPLALTDYRLRVIPKDSGDTIKSTGIGTGPFKLEKFDPQGVTVLVANPSYYDGAPKLARIEVIGIPDAQARFQALLGGQIDMEPGLAPQQRVLLERSGKNKIQDVPTGNWRGIAFKTDVKPFDDVRVRRAIRMAVDRKALLALAARGQGVIGCDTPVGPNDQYRVVYDVAKTCPQDIAGAKALLKEAGYPNGITFDLQVTNIEPVWPAIAEAFQQQVAPAGIKVNIVQVPSDGYWSEIWLKKDVVMTRWGQRPADGVLNEVYRSGAAWNESRFTDKQFDLILDNARREVDLDKRRALYGDAQEYLRLNGGTLVAYHANVVVGTTARVVDLDPVEYFSIRWNLLRVTN